MGSWEVDPYELPSQFFPAVVSGCILIAHVAVNGEELSNPKSPYRVDSNGIVRVRLDSFIEVIDE